MFDHCDNCGRLLLLIAVVIALWAGTMFLAPQMPRCEEDAVLVGVGDFDKGTWQGYECGPALDDFVQE